jgi:hypothetical protein
MGIRFLVKRQISPRVFGRFYVNLPDLAIALPVVDVLLWVVRCLLQVVGSFLPDVVCIRLDVGCFLPEKGRLWLDPDGREIF